MTFLGNPCPFHGEKGRCGIPVVTYDAEQTSVICGKGHISSIDHLPPKTDAPKVTPLVYRIPRRTTEIPFRDIALGLLVLELVVRTIL